MAADISHLGQLQAGEPLEGENYPDANESRPTPRKGRYIFQAPASFGQDAFSASRANALLVAVNPTIVSGGPAGQNVTGTVVRQKVSAKPFKRGGLTVSQLGDYLRATGVTTMPRTPEEQAELAASTAGRTYQGDLDWEARCRGCNYEVKGEANFPQVDGVPQPYVDCPNCQNESGSGPLRLRAWPRISRFVVS